MDGLTSETIVNQETLENYISFGLCIILEEVWLQSFDKYIINKICANI